MFVWRRLYRWAVTFEAHRRPLRLVILLSKHAPRHIYQKLLLVWRVNLLSSSQLQSRAHQSKGDATAFYLNIAHSNLRAQLFCDLCLFEATHICVRLILVQVVYCGRGEQNAILFRLKACGWRTYRVWFIRDVFWLNSLLKTVALWHRFWHLLLWLCFGWVIGILWLLFSQKCCSLLCFKFSSAPTASSFHPTQKSLENTVMLHLEQKADVIK